MSRGSLGRSAAALLLVCATLSCARGEPGATRVLRLIDRLGQAEVQGPETTAPPRPEDARPSRIVRPALRDHIARVAMPEAAEVTAERIALFGPVGTTYRFRIDSPVGGKLRLGLGSPASSVPYEPVRFVVRAGDADGATRIFETRVEEPGWRDFEIELPPGAEPPYGLTLKSASKSAGGRWAAWSSPEVVSTAEAAGEDGPAQTGWDVILVSLDTLRADHLGCYGYSRPTSPFLDRFAADSFRFATAVSAAPWTLPAHRALFTGLYPLSRGDRTAPPLASRLWRAGYRTEAWTGGGVMDFRMGLARGFDTYRTHDWIRDLDTLVAGLEPSFGNDRLIFLHTYEPHDPYIHPELARGLPSGRLGPYFDKGLWGGMSKTLTDEEKAYVEALYDGDIAYTDRQLGKLFERLEAGGVLDRSIVVITSDHGEQFWEHGSWRHGQNLYDHQLLVPLILRLPDELAARHGIPRNAGVIETQVRTIDLYPTLLELLGIPSKKEVQGRSLVPLLRGEELPEIPALAESLNVVHSESKAVRFRGHKFIRSRAMANPPGPPVDELYELRGDPGESVSLLDARPDLARSFVDRLQALTAGSWDDGRPALDRQELDEDLRDKLRALGYLGEQ